MHTYISIHTVHTDVCMYVCICACMHTYRHAYIQTDMHARLHIDRDRQTDRLYNQTYRHTCILFIHLQPLSSVNSNLCFFLFFFSFSAVYRFSPSAFPLLLHRSPLDLTTPTHQPPSLYPSISFSPSCPLLSSVLSRLTLQPCAGHRFRLPHGLILHLQLNY